MHTQTEGEGEGPARAHTYARFVLPPFFGSTGAAQVAHSEKKVQLKNYYIRKGYIIFILQKITIILIFIVNFFYLT